jgi:hypothetical protein
VSAAEDRADVERVLRGDVCSFEGIVHRWQGPLINLAWRFCRDRYRTELKRIPAATTRLEAIAEPKDSRAIDGGLEEKNRDQIVR